MSATTTPSSAGSAGVAGSAGDPLAEAVELTRRLKLPHIRRHLLELVPTARAQRWDHAELVRVLLAEEAAGRDATNLRTRRARAGFPAGKTLQDWDAAASTIPRPTKTPSPAWNGSGGGRTSASAARPGPGRATSAKRSARPRSRPG